METPARILLMDADLQTLSATAQLLQEAGHQVTQSVTGDEGLRLAKDIQPDLILIDGTLPDINDCEVCQRIKSDPILTHSFVILISNLSASPDNQAEVLKAGADEFILRPVSDRDLLARVQAMLRIKQAEDLLRESEGRYRTIVEDMPVLICRFLPDGTLTFVNDHYCRYFNAHPDDLVGKNFFQFIPDEQRAEVRQHYSSLTLKNPAKTYEHQVLAPDGTTRWQRWTDRALFDPQGFPVEYQSIGEDITEQVQRNLALQDSEERYRRLLELTFNGIAIHSSGKFDFINPSGAKLLGANSPEQVVGMSVMDFVHPDYHAMVRERFRQLDDNKPAPLIEEKFIHLDGEQIDVEVTAIPITYHNKPATQVVFRDITARKQAEAALRANQALLRSAIESIPFDFFALDGGGRYILQNSTCKDRWGDLLGKRLDEISGSKEGPELWQRNNQRALAGETVAEQIVLEVDGTLEHYYNVISPIQVGDEITGILGVNIDIGEWVKSQEALKETSQLLETILDHTHILVAYLDTDFNYITVNRAFAEANDHPATFFPGKNRFELYPDPENEAIFQDVVITGEQYIAYAKPFEYDDYAERGITYWDWSLVPIKNEAGNAVGVVLTLEEVTWRVRASESLRLRSQQLNERLKELDCLYGISNLVETPGITLEEILLGTVDLIPDAWQYPEIVCARIMLNGQNFETESWVESEWKQTSEIVIHGQKEGVLEVCYLETRPDLDEGPFLKEERVLINAITQRLGRIVERKNAETELRKLSRAVEQSRVSVIITDDQGNIEYVNPGFELLTGYSADEVFGQKPSIIKSGAHSEAFYKGLWNTITEGREWRGEFYNKKKSGEFYWESASISPVKNIEGVTTHFVAVKEDITDRKLAEQALRESEQKFRDLAEQLPNMVFINSRGRIVYVNQACEEMMGYSREKFYAQDFNFLNLISPEYTELVNSKYVSHMQGEEVESYEYSILPKEGDRIDVINTTKLISYEGERAILGIVTDISERKQMEADLRATRDELATLLAISQNIVSTLELEPLLNVILEQLKRVVNFDGAAVLTLDQDAMIVQAYQGYPLPLDILSLQFSLAQVPVIEKMVSDQQGFYLPDLKADLSLAASVEQVIGLPIEELFQESHALMSVPLIAKGEVVGMLVLAHDQPGYYHAATMEKVQAFANQVAIAIDNAHLYKQAQEVAVIAERNRLASDLHDSVTQALFSATLVTEVLPQIWEQDPEEGRLELAKLRRLTRGALAEMRTMLLELRPNALERTNLSDLLEQLTELMTNQENIVVTAAIDPVPDLPPDVQIAFYRVGQESLNNVLKHARANQVTISLRAYPPYDSNQEEWRGRVALHVSDDGRGFHPDHVFADQMGLKIMAERAESISAQLNLTSQPDEGTQVVLIWENNYIEPEEDAYVTTATHSRDDR